jgi:predicted RND superfamily exporter protein
VLLWTFGLMAALGIAFSPVTATISALAIGIGVPFTIHVAIRFQEDRLRYDDPGDAVRSTTRFTGGALAGSAFTTMAGFLVLRFSSLPPFQQLGTVVAIAVGCSLIAAVLVLPSMLILWDGWHRRRGDAPATTEPRETTRTAV